MPKLTLIVFSGDFDKAFVSLLLGSRAAAEGWDVTMFFTFWGLGIIRDPKKTISKRDRVERTFDKKVPRGADDLVLSQMDVFGLGTSKMKKRMSEKKMLTIREMMREAKEFGVRFLACSIPMEIMGIRKEEFVEEVDDICSVGDYLEKAKDADVNLFI